MKKGWFIYMCVCVNMQNLVFLCLSETYCLYQQSLRHAPASRIVQDLLIDGHLIAVQVYLNEP